MNKESLFFVLMIRSGSEKSLIIYEVVEENSKKILYKSAKGNTQRFERPKIRSMVQVLCGIMEEENPDTYFLYCYDLMLLNRYA